MSRATGAATLMPKILAWVVLGLMAVATVYTAWIVLANYHRIGV